MPETIGEAYVAIRPNVDGFANEAQSKIAGPLQAALGGISTAVVGQKIGQFFRGAIDEATSAAKIGAQTEAVLRSTGEAAGISAKHVSDLAGTLSDLAAVDDEVIQGGENVLLTFTAVRNEAGRGNNVFDQATKAALNMSVALGTDLQGSIIQVGKALNDPIAGITALSRVGVSFTESQKEMIASLVRSGDVLGAQKVILAELQKEFGGAAKSQATDAARLALAYGNLKESIGTALLPVVNALAKALTPLANLLAQNKIAATAFALVVSGGLLASLVAWTVRMGQATLATFGFAGAQAAAATATTAETVAMESQLVVIESFTAAQAGAAASSGAMAAGAGSAAAGLSLWAIPAIAAVALAKTLKDTFIASKPVYHETTENFQRMTDAQLAMSAHFQLTETSAGTFGRTLRQLAAEAPVTARRLVDAAALPAAAHDRFMRVIDRVVAATQRQAAAAQQDANAMNSLSGATEDATRTLADYHNALIDSTDSQLSAESSAISMDRAIASYNETAKDANATTLEQRSSLNSAEQAIVSFGKKIYDGKAATGDWLGATRDQIGALEGVRDGLAPGSPLRTFLDEYIWKLGHEVPPVVATTLKLTVEQIAQGIIAGGGSGQGEFSPINPATGLPWGATPFGASGAIVRRPTYALIGEAGPEAVVPLNQTLGNSPLPGDGGVHFHFEGGAPVDPITAAHITARVYRVHNAMAGR